jgi:hypothetical protein
MSNELNSLNNKLEDIIALNAKTASLNSNKHISKKAWIRRSSLRKGTTIQRTNPLDNRHGKPKDPYLMKLSPKQKRGKIGTTVHIIRHGAGTKAKKVSKV